MVVADCQPTLNWHISQDFYEKYQFLIGPESADLGVQINAFLTGLEFTSEHFQIGKTKVHSRLNLGTNT